MKPALRDAIERARDALLDWDVVVDDTRCVLDVAERERDRAARHLQALISSAAEQYGIAAGGPEAA
jgi:hypothetical protein